MSVERQPGPPAPMWQYRTASPPGQCEALDCDRAWAVLLPDRWLAPRLTTAVFGPDHPGEGYCVCHRHYRLLRSRDGIVLGYRQRRGKLETYVKQELF